VHKVQLWLAWYSVLLSVLGKRKAGNLKDFLLGETVNIKFWSTYWLYKLKFILEITAMLF